MQILKSLSAIMRTGFRGFMATLAIGFDLRAFPINNAVAARWGNPAGRRVSAGQAPSKCSITI